MSEGAAPIFVPLKAAAKSLGLPAAWLADEARRGRIPALMVGADIRMDVAAVADALRARRATDAEPPHEKDDGSELAAQKGDAMISMRRLERLGRGDAIRACLRGVEQDHWMRRCAGDAIETLGLYRFPAQEDRRVVWPGMVLRFVRETDGAPLEAWFAAYFDTEGDLQAATIAGLPDDSMVVQVRRPISEGPGQRPAPSRPPDAGPSQPA